MRCFALACFLASLTPAAPAFSQETVKPLVHEPVLDGITLSASGQATDFDRFVLLVTPSESSTAGTPSSDGSAVYRNLRDALTRYGLSETDMPAIYPYPNRTGLAFLLPKTFDGKNIGSGSVGDVLRAVVKAGGDPTGTLISSYSPARLAQARRDAQADALKNGRKEAEALASVADRKLGKVLAIRVEPSPGFNPIVSQPIRSSGLENAPYSFNGLTLTLRFAIE